MISWPGQLAVPVMPLWPWRWSISEPVHSEDKIRERESDELWVGTEDGQWGEMSEVLLWPSAADVRFYLELSLRRRTAIMRFDVAATIVCGLWWTTTRANFSKHNKRCKSLGRFSPKACVFLGNPPAEGGLWSNVVMALAILWMLRSWYGSPHCYHETAFHQSCYRYSPPLYLSLTHKDTLVLRCAIALAILAMSSALLPHFLKSCSNEGEICSFLACLCTVCVCKSGCIVY